MAISLHDFMQIEAQPQPMLIGRGILPVRGKMIIGAPPKANKSWIAINLCLGLAKGTSLFNAVYKSTKPVFPVTRPCRVLYLEQENGVDGTQTRLRGLLGDNPPDIPFFLKTRDTAMRVDTPEGEAFIRKELEQVRPDVVVFDPLAKFHLSDENSSQEMGYNMRVLDHFIEDYGCAVVVIHHTKKPNPMNESRGGDRLRGSSAVFADVDTLMEVERLSNETVLEPLLKVTFELRRGEPIEPLHFKRLKSGEVVYMGEEFVWGGSREPAARRTRFQNV